MNALSGLSDTKYDRPLAGLGNGRLVKLLSVNNGVRAKRRATFQIVLKRRPRLLLLASYSVRVIH